jgi:anti-sigma factor RsiW
MEVTRNVILDLLPLYLADEVSADTRALVAKHLEDDPELARAAQEMLGSVSSRDVPVPLTKEAGMEAYLEAKRLQYRRTVLFTVTGAAMGILVPLVIAVIYLVVKG